MDVPELPNPFMHVGSAESAAEFFYNMLDVRLIDRNGKTVTVHMRDGSKAPIGCPTVQEAVRLCTELRTAWRDTWMRWREAGAVK